MKVVWRSRELSTESSHGESKNSFDPNLPPLITRFLRARGFQDHQEVLNWVQPKLADLKDPYLMKNMDVGVERLVKAFKNQETVCIYADFDLDGTSGLGLLYEGFRQLGFKNLRFYQPKRLTEGYGFHDYVVKELAQEGVNVIVTVDVGITALEAAAEAKLQNIDVVITDHHQPCETLPEALAVINPNQKEDTSGLGYLCGAGVGFYLLRALKRGLVNENLISDRDLDLKSVLDCFCIGTLTDMVPLVGDNRVLVKQGLTQLQHTRRPGLRALLEELGMSGRPLTSQDVAIRFAPKLNALSRMELGVLPIDLYMVEDEGTARDLVKTVMKHNDTRVQLQATGESQAFEMLKSWPHDNFIFLSSDQFHRGVVGLIATKVSMQMNVPTFIGSLSKDGTITGSGRLPAQNKTSLLPALESAEKFLMRFGGHNAAAGFELQASSTEDFTRALAAHYEKMESGSAEVEVHFDLKADLKDINDVTMKWLDQLGPFGQSFPIPLMAFEGVRIDSVLKLRGGHLKLKVEQSGRMMEALFFSPGPDAETQLATMTHIDILAEAQWNYFAGKTRAQLLIKDFKNSHESALNPSHNPQAQTPNLSLQENSL